MSMVSGTFEVHIRPNIGVGQLNISIFASHILSLLSHLRLLYLSSVRTTEHWWIRHEITLPLNLLQLTVVSLGRQLRIATVTVFKQPSLVL